MISFLNVGVSGAFSSRKFVLKIAFRIVLYALKLLFRRVVYLDRVRINFLVVMNCPLVNHDNGTFRKKVAFIPIVLGQIMV